jgi:hypothetical protein
MRKMVELLVIHEDMLIFAQNNYHNLIIEKSCFVRIAEPKSPRMQ